MRRRSVASGVCCTTRGTSASVRGPGPSSERGSVRFCPACGPACSRPRLAAGCCEPAPREADACASAPLAPAGAFADGASDLATPFAAVGWACASWVFLAPSPLGRARWKPPDSPAATSTPARSSVEREVGPAQPYLSSTESMSAGVSGSLRSRTRPLEMPLALLRTGPYEILASTLARRTTMPCSSTVSFFATIALSLRANSFSIPSNDAPGSLFLIVNASCGPPTAEVPLPRDQHITFVTRASRPRPTRRAPPRTRRPRSSRAPTIEQRHAIYRAKRRSRLRTFEL